MRGYVPGPDALLNDPLQAKGESSHHFHIKVHLLLLVSMVVNNVSSHNIFFALTFESVNMIFLSPVRIPWRFAFIWHMNASFSAKYTLQGIANIGDFTIILWLWIFTYETIFRWTFLSEWIRWFKVIYVLFPWCFNKFYPFFVSYCLSPEAKATSGQRHYNCQLPLLLLYSLLLLARCEVLRLTEAYRSKRPRGSFNEHQIPKSGASTGATLRCGHQARRIINFYQELICQEPNQSELKVLAFLTRPSGGCTNTLLKNWVVLLSLATM